MPAQIGILEPGTWVSVALELGIVPGTAPVPTTFKELLGCSLAADVGPLAVVGMWAHSGQLESLLGLLAVIYIFHPGLSILLCPVFQPYVALKSKILLSQQGSGKATIGRQLCMLVAVSLLPCLISEQSQEVGANDPFQFADEEVLREAVTGPDIAILTFVSFWRPHYP
ncbi:hypothetical protein H920_15097 [Fukomys damarensis]|uniref:Uncharacterized protein n=1 Tax=Fukomys damarensis TaxID=885580 RepID=A0A091CV92_FUKDA|nr:hypothetical protein H920_15097 [Fukomys damarensis]